MALGTGFSLDLYNEYRMPTEMVNSTEIKCIILNCRLSALRACEIEKLSKP